MASVPKGSRRRGDPWTPNKHQVCSKRSWDGQVRKWRRALHKYDPEGTVEGDEDVNMENKENIEVDTIGECDNDHE